MLQNTSSVFIVYRRKTLTGSPDPTHANGTDKPCTGTCAPPFSVHIVSFPCGFWQTCYKIIVWHRTPSGVDTHAPWKSLTRHCVWVICYYVDRIDSYYFCIWWTFFVAKWVYPPESAVPTANYNVLTNDFAFGSLGPLVVLQHITYCVCPWIFWKNVKV